MKLTFVESLFEDIEPLIFVAVSPQHKLYLCLAIADEEMANPFICYRATESVIEELKSGDLDIKSTFVEPSRSAWYTGDFTSDTFRVKSLTNSLWEVPQEHWPEDGLFVADQSVNDTVSYTINIDGPWSSENFIALNRAFIQVHSIGYGLETYPDDRIVEVASSRRLTDGFSSHHLIKEFQSSVPFSCRPDVEELMYASPGHVTYRSSKIGADLFQKACDTLRNDYSDFKKEYITLHKYLKETNLLGVKASDFVTNVNDPIHQNIANKCRPIINRLGITNIRNVDLMSGNRLGIAKILLVLARRIEEIAPLIFSGRVGDGNVGSSN